MTNWTTLYITGRKDFREEVRKRFQGSKFDIMPGYIEQPGSTGTYDLYWVNETVNLRDLKEVLGSKLIWRYRLRFYTELEDFLQHVGGSNPSVDPEDEDIPFGMSTRHTA